MSESFLFVKGILFVFICLSFFSAVWAQSDQIGYVLEYQEGNRKTPLANVEIVANNAGSTITDKRGRFTLHFRTLGPGDRIHLRHVVKPGYEVFNMAALENLHVSNQDDPIEIILIKTETLAAMRRTMVTNATRQADLQLEQVQQELDRKFRQNEFDRQEYEERLKEIQKAYEEKLENIDNYIDRFVHIDLTELNEQERKILNLVHEGRFEEAISIYNETDRINELALLGHNRRKLESDAQTLRQTLTEIQAEKAELFNSLNRQVDLLRMQGGTRNLQRIQQLLHDIAFADTTDLPPVFTYGRELRRNAKFHEALELYRNLSQWALLKNDTIQFYRSNMFEGVCQYKLGNDKEADEILRNAMWKYVALLQHTSDSIAFIPDLAYGSNIFGQLLCKKGHYDHGRDFFQYGLALLHKYQKQGGQFVSSEIESQYANMLVCASNSLEQSRFLEESIFSCREAIRILDRLYKAQPYLYREALAFAWTSLGKHFLLQQGSEPKSENAFRKALQYYEEGEAHNPDFYRRLAAECRQCLGDLYFARNDFEQAIGCYRWSLDVWTHEHTRNSDLIFDGKLSHVCRALSKCYLELEDYASALSYCKRALSFQPDEEENYTLLRKLQEITDRDEGFTSEQ